MAVMAHLSLRSKGAADGIIRELNRRGCRMRLKIIVEGAKQDAGRRGRSGRQVFEGLATAP